MLIVSQNKEKVLLFGISFNALQYVEMVESIDRKGNGGKIRHTICISDGCLEEIAEYPTKERCLAVLKDFCGVYADGCYTEKFFDIGAQATRPAIYNRNIVYEFPNKVMSYSKG